METSFTSNSQVILQPSSPTPPQPPALAQILFSSTSETL